MQKALYESIKLYLGEVSQYLDCADNEKAAITDAIEESIMCIVEDTPNATIEDITKKFGTPENAAKAYSGEGKTFVVKDNFFTKKMIALFSLGAFALTLIVLLLIIFLS